MPARRQTLPQITLGYVVEEVTGQPTWTLSVSDGEHAAEPVKVSPETAAGIAQIVDVALPLPLDLNGEATSAERVVRFAHVQTLEAQLHKAQAGLKATSFARSTTVPGPAEVTDPAPAPVRPARARRGAKAKDAGEGAVATVVPINGAGQEPPAPVVPTQPEEPVLETAPGGDVPLPDEPPLVDEPPHYSDLPESLPRRSHLEVPPIDEF